MLNFQPRAILSFLVEPLNGLNIFRTNLGEQIQKVLVLSLIWNMKIQSILKDNIKYIIDSNNT